MLAEQITSEEYMDGCMPPWASCVGCGILMWHDRDHFGCGHCGITVYVNWYGKMVIGQLPELRESKA